MDIVPEPIERYAEEHTTPPEPLLAELAKETRETLESPQMLTGTVEGRFVVLLGYASGARGGTALRPTRLYTATAPPSGTLDHSTGASARRRGTLASAQ